MNFSDFTGRHSDVLKSIDLGSVVVEADCFTALTRQGHMLSVRVGERYVVECTGTPQARQVLTASLPEPEYVAWIQAVRHLCPRAVPKAGAQQ